jgi:hypothetical protein
MIAHRFLSAAFIVGLFAPHSAFALDWEIERNFRYFLYPSDMAAQRVARDLGVQSESNCVQDHTARILECRIPGVPKRTPPIQQPASDFQGPAEVRR